LENYKLAAPEPIIEVRPVVNIKVIIRLVASRFNIADKIK
jgi:hypothetical protein